MNFKQRWNDQKTTGKTKHQFLCLHTKSFFAFELHNLRVVKKQEIHFELGRLQKSNCFPHILQGRGIYAFFI